jgi:hypothetical protein
MLSDLKTFIQTTWFAFTSLAFCIELFILIAQGCRRSKYGAHIELFYHCFFLFNLDLFLFQTLYCPIRLLKSLILALTAHPQN